jgi:hypothetical protein
MSSRLGPFDNQAVPSPESNWNISEEHFVQQLMNTHNADFSWSIEEEQFIRELTSGQDRTSDWDNSG